MQRCINWTNNEEYIINVGREGLIWEVGVILYIFDSDGKPKSILWSRQCKLFYYLSLSNKEPKLGPVGGAGIIVSTVLCACDVLLCGWHNDNDTSCYNSSDLDEWVFQLTCCSVQDLGLKEYAGVHVSNAGEEQPFGLNWPTRDYNLKNTWQRLEEHHLTITLAGGSFWISQFRQRWLFEFENILGCFSSLWPFMESRSLNGVYCRSESGFHDNSGPELSKMGMWPDRDPPSAAWPLLGDNECECDIYTFQ